MKITLAVCCVPKDAILPWVFVSSVNLASSLSKTGQHAQHALLEPLVMKAWIALAVPWLVWDW